MWDPRPEPGNRSPPGGRPRRVVPPVPGSRPGNREAGLRSRGRCRRGRPHSGPGGEATLRWEGFRHLRPPKGRVRTGDRRTRSGRRHPKIRERQRAGSPEEGLRFRRSVFRDTRPCNPPKVGFFPFWMRMQFVCRSFLDTGSKGGRKGRSGGTELFHQTIDLEVPGVRGQSGDGGVSFAPARRIASPIRSGVKLRESISLS